MDRVMRTPEASEGGDAEEGERVEVVRKSVFVGGLSVGGGIGGGVRKVSGRGRGRGWGRGRGK